MRPGRVRMEGAARLAPCLMLMLLLRHENLSAW